MLLGALAFSLGATWPTGEESEFAWTSSALGVGVQDVSVGAGELVVERAGVSVHYVGMLEDGTVFDASRERGTPLDIRLGSGMVIQGWEDGLLGMRVGGVRRLVIPPELGYGAQQVGQIPPDSTLYFEVEMMSVELPRVAPAEPTPVAADAWRTMGAVSVADVVAGSGKRVKVKPGQRVCIDYATFDAYGQLAEHTYDRDRCTWYRLTVKDELPTELEAGLKGAREGGRRLIRGADAVWQVSVEAVGI